MYKHWDNQKRAILDLVAKNGSATCHVVNGTNYPIFFRNLHSDLLLKRTTLPVYVDMSHISKVSLKTILKYALMSAKRALVEKKLSSKVELLEETEDSLKASLQELIKENEQKNLSVVFFFEDIALDSVEIEETLAYLEKLRASSAKCSFFYLVKSNISHPDKFSKLKYFPHLYENLLYFPVRDEETVKTIEKGISPKQFKTIYGLTGGVDSFLSVALDLRNSLSTKEKKNIQKYILNNQHLQREVRKLWDTLSASEINLLAQIIWGIKAFDESLKHDVDYLCNLGLIRKGKKGFELGVGLLKYVGIEKNLDHKVEYQKNEVTINGHKVNIKFSESEKRVLKELVSNKNKIVGKTTLKRYVGKGLNGKGEVAVDNVVSLIRTKLSNVWVNPGKLTHVEGKGYIYFETR